jgi:hypothetical protein
MEKKYDKDKVKEDRKIKVEEITSKIIDRFKNNEAKTDITQFCLVSGMPSEKWSFANRLICVINNTFDARGFNQWLSVGRQVIKGSKAFYILAPRMVKKNKNTVEEKIETVPEKEKETEKDEVITFFVPVPVFSVEKTEGEPLPALKLKYFPFQEVAENWNIPIEGVSFLGKKLGSYSLDEKKIRIACNHEIVFFHELAHAAHARIEILQGGQVPGQEIIAEFTACCLAEIAQIDIPLGEQYHYIETYAKQLKTTPEKAIFRFLGTIEKVIKLILGETETENT